MKLEFQKTINVNISDKFYGIIEASTRTYNGVYEIIVDKINWNEEYIVFDIEQPCQQVMVYFYDFDKYVFNTKEEANQMYEKMYTVEGLTEY